MRAKLIFIAILPLAFLGLAFFSYFHHCRGNDPENNEFLGINDGPIDFSPKVIYSGTWVTVTWSGLTESDIKNGSGVFFCIQDSYCTTIKSINTWIGVFYQSANLSAIDPPDWPTAQPPWLASFPIKWKPIDTTSGKIQFFMERAREDLQFALFKNGSTYPVLVAKTSPLVFLDQNIHGYVHLALTGNPSEMRVMWQSGVLDPGAQVRWGFVSGYYLYNTSSSVSTYSVDDLCGPPATTAGWSNPGYFYRSVLKNIPPDSIVYYVVGSDAVGYTPEYHFKSPKPPNPVDSLKITVIADVGLTYIDGSQYHWMEPYAINTTNNVISAWSDSTPKKSEKDLYLAQSTFADDGLDKTDVVLHVGDIAYATGHASKWDRFMAQIEPIASRVPYMTGQGNHERDYPGSGDFFGGGDSGGECGRPTQERFIMPTPSKKQESGWYSFEQGPVHFIMMDTELECGPGSSQYSFFQTDLKSVNRSVTPWVIFMGHRPMYYANQIDTHFQVFEELLYENKVDLCLWGHVHNAQRTCPVYKGQCIESVNGSYDAPIHAVIGNGGQSLSPFPPPRAKWSIYQELEFGFSTIEVVKNNLTMRFYGDAKSVLHHQFSIVRNINAYQATNTQTNTENNNNNEI